ncbi:MAG: hypothetical protein GWP59_05475 [Chlamydiales bacterium]|nr:hypothetical protein [Chlamydiales bacterium]
MKHLLCFLNSMTDVPLKQLGDKTPLSIANTENLDQLSQKWGLHVLERENRVEKFDVLTSLLDLSIPRGLLNTGYLEAASQSILLSEGDWAFSVRFISQGEGVIVDTSNTLASDQEGNFLCSLLNEFLEKKGIRFIHLKGPRAIMTGSSDTLSQSLWGQSVALKEVVGMQSTKALPGGNSNQELVQLLEEVNALLEKSEVNTMRQDLEELPINGIFLSGGGTALPKKYFSKGKEYQDALIYSKDPCIQGLSKLLGMDLWKLSFEEREYDHLRLLSKGLTEKFLERDLIFLDIDYIWESTYQGMLREKVKRIEYLDRYWVGPLINLARELNIELSFMSLDHVDISKGCRKEGNLWSLSSLENFKGKKVDKFNEASLASARASKLTSFFECSQQSSLLSL